jgi:hypothetical protein
MVDALAGIAAPALHKAASFAPHNGAAPLTGMTAGEKREQAAAHAHTFPMVV